MPAPPSTRSPILTLMFPFTFPSFPCSPESPPSSLPHLFSASHVASDRQLSICLIRNPACSAHPVICHPPVALPDLVCTNHVVAVLGGVRMGVTVLINIFSRIAEVSEYPSGCSTFTLFRFCTPTLLYLGVAFLKILSATDHTPSPGDGIRFFGKPPL